MNKSLYQISQELDSIFTAIEDNGGEITEELAKELEINESNLKDKIDAYCQAIAMYNSSITCCKDEKNRINNIQNTKKNIVEKLKSTLLETVNKYGYEGKSNNKIIDLDTHKLYTKNTYTFAEDNNRTELLIKTVLSYIEELAANGIFESGQNIDMEGFINSINAIAFAKLQEGNTPVEEWAPFTVEDLKVINLSAGFKLSLFDILESYGDLANAIAKYPTIFKDIDKSIDADTVKFLNTLEKPITIAYPITKQSLIIK